MYSMKNSRILHEASKAKHKTNVIVQLLIFAAIFAVVQMVAGIVIGIPVGISLSAQIMQTVDPNAILNGEVDLPELMKQLMGNLPEWFNVVNLLATGLMTLAVMLYCRRIEGRSYASMGLSKKGFFKNYVKGLVIGAVMIAAAAGLTVLMGGAQITLADKISWLYIALFFAGYLVQGMSEEFMCRGYLCVSLANKVKLSVAVGISSVVFAMLHLANPGLSLLAMINLALFGVFMAVYMFRTDDLWGVCAIHSAWNFLQGNILGFSVSGVAAKSSVFTSSYVGGKELISGGAFGLEGGICATIVLLAAILLTLLLPMKPRPAIVEEPQEREAERKEIPLYIQK